MTPKWRKLQKERVCRKDPAMNYHNITKDDMLNGDGLRVVLWVSGCSHGCKGCHNRITWDPNGGLLFDEAAKEEIFTELEKDYVSGLTLSGGDPLFPGNRSAIDALVREVKEKYPGKTIWLYTGYSWEEIKSLPLIQYVDIVVDGKFVESLKDNKLHWRGSSNQRVIDVKNKNILL
jgi:anaerobic ribonucleoside-triphosphate reductase activating protein